MMRLKWLTVILFMAIAQLAAWARLPDAGLARAREAEQALAGGDTKRAIEILVELDAQYPNEPAVNLRLAEIYDQEGQPGAALYYYRRYVQLAGARARADARQRVQTLEMTAGAREAADVIAQRLGRKVRAVGTPTPQVQQAIEKVLPDGARVRVNSPQELMSDRIDPRRIVAPSPTTSRDMLARADVIIREGEDGSTQALAVTRATPRPVFTPPPIEHELAAGPIEAARQTAGPIEATRETAGPIEVARQAAAQPLDQRGFGKPDDAAPTATPSPTPEKTPRGVVKIQFAPAARTTTAERSHSTPAPTAPPQSSSVPSPQTAAAQEKPAVPGVPTVHLPMTDPDKFFIIHQSGGDKARLSLANEIENSVLVLSALPTLSTPPVNAIVGPGEMRTYDVAPGRYVVQVKITDNSYPPVTLLDTRFDYTFEGGTSYARQFLPSDVGRASATR
jgi:hypothetical protein